MFHNQKLNITIFSSFRTIREKLLTTFITQLYMFEVEKIILCKYIA